MGAYEISADESVWMGKEGKPTETKLQRGTKADSMNCLTDGNASHNPGSG